MVVCWQTAVPVFRLASMLFGSLLASGWSVILWLASGRSVCFVAGQWPISLFCGWPVADQFLCLASGRWVCFVAGQWPISLFCVWPVADQFLCLASGRWVCFVAGQWPISLFCVWPVAKISLFCVWPVADQFVLWLTSGWNQFVLWLTSGWNQFVLCLASGQNLFVLCLASGQSVCFVSGQWPVSLFCVWPVADQFVLWLTSGWQVCFITPLWEWQNDTWGNDSICALVSVWLCFLRRLRTSCTPALDTVWRPTSLELVIAITTTSCSSSQVTCFTSTSPSFWGMLRCLATLKGMVLCGFFVLGVDVVVYTPCCCL